MGPTNPRKPHNIPGLPLQDNGFGKLVEIAATGNWCHTPFTNYLEGDSSLAARNDGFGPLGTTKLVEKLVPHTLNQLPGGRFLAGRSERRVWSARNDEIGGEIGATHP